MFRKHSQHIYIIIPFERIHFNQASVISLKEFSVACSLFIQARIHYWFIMYIITITAPSPLCYFAAFVDAAGGKAAAAAAAANRSRRRRSPAAPCILTPIRYQLIMTYVYGVLHSFLSSPP